jgi:archaeosine-15-forming tRNA-guanine transglycosylase
MSEREKPYREPMRRIVVKDSAVPFVSRGVRVFAGQIVGFDQGVEDGELVQVVDTKNSFLSTVRVFL